MTLCQSTINWPMTEAGFIVTIIIIDIIIIIIITKRPDYMACKTLHVVVQCHRGEVKNEKWFQALNFSRDNWDSA